MTWKVRHQGSPRPVEGLTPQQVAEGLNEGLWETTDEVMGPNDTSWVPLENHPQFAEIAAEIEPPPPHTYDDETHLDFTALIDVTLVLLIFYILTASYAALASRLDSPDLQPGTNGRLCKPEHSHIVGAGPAMPATAWNGCPILRGSPGVRTPMGILRVTFGRRWLLYWQPHKAA